MAVSTTAGSQLVNIDIVDDFAEISCWNGHVNDVAVQKVPSDLTVFFFFFFYSQLEHHLKRSE